MPIRIRRTMSRLWPLLLSAALVSSCSSTTHATPAAKAQPKTKLAKIKGSGARTDYVLISIDDYTIPHSIWSGYPHVYVKPGEHVITYFTKGTREGWVYWTERNVKSSTGTTTVFEHTRKRRWGDVDYARRTSCVVEFQAGVVYDRKKLKETFEALDCSPMYHRRGD